VLDRMKLNARVIVALSSAPIIDEFRSMAQVPAAAARTPTHHGRPPGMGILALVIENLETGAGITRSLLKRMSAAGGDAVSGDGRVLLAAPGRAWDAFLSDLASAPGDLRDVAAELRRTLDAYGCRHFEVSMGPRRLTIGPQPILMGILNVTPDSFSDGGRFLDPRDAVAQAERMAIDGAAIIDVGGESTRPGSDPVGEDEESARVLPIIREIVARLDVPVSIDTRHAHVARMAVDAGACLVNDVTGLAGDPDMARTVADTGAGLVLMHMQGEPRSMQDHPHYDHLMADICRRLRRSVEQAAEAGVPEDRIIIDPGIGFGKTLEHNIEILARLGQLRSIGRPIMVGVSRKRFIGDLTGVRTPSDRVCGTAAACAMAVAAGALVLRVHDVREAREAVAVAFAISRQSTVIPSERGESRNLAVRVGEAPVSQRDPSTSLGVTTKKDMPETSGAAGGSA
jgi:dihydropteroate synthase